jgi:succinoglycan biosynthesis transport protein ExoP
MTTVPNTAGTRARPASSAPATMRPPVAAAPTAPGITVDPIRLFRRHLKLLIATFFVGIVLGIAAHFICLRFFPSYSAAAIFYTSPIVQDIVEREKLTQAELDELEMFMRTQAWEMTADNVLMKAANAPAIKNQTKWAKRFHDPKTASYDHIEAFLELKEDVSAGAIPETFYLRLGMKTHDPNDAPTILNTIGEVYIQELRNRQQIEGSDTRATLTEELGKLRQRKKTIEEEMDAFLAEHNMSVVEEGMSSEQLALNAITMELQQSKSVIEQIRESLSHYESSYATEGVVNYPESIRAESENHPRIAALLNQVVTFRAARRAALEQYGPNHREVQAIERQIRAMAQEIEVEKERIMRMMLAAQIDTYRNAEQTQAHVIAELEAELKIASDRMRDLTSALEEYQRLEGDQETLTEQIKLYDDRIKSMILVETADAAQRVRLWNRAAKPEEVSFPQIEIMVPGVTILALALVTGFLFLRELVDQRVKSPSDVSHVTHTPILGFIPELREDPAAPDEFDLIVKNHPQGVIAESFRQIRMQLSKLLERSDSKVVVAVSASPGAGGTSLLTNLAVSCAAEEKRVLLIDANFRRPQAHLQFGLEEEPGLADVLAQQTSLAEACQKTEIGNLDFLGAGEARHRVVEWLGVERMTKILDEARASYDLVFIASPPAIVAGDAEVLANQVDASFLIARAMRDKRGMIGRVSNQLKDSRSQFLGTVVNGIRCSAGGYYKKNIQAMDSYYRSETTNAND